MKGELLDLSVTCLCLEQESSIELALLGDLRFFFFRIKQIYFLFFPKRGRKCWSDNDDVDDERMFSWWRKPTDFGRTDECKTRRNKPSDKRSSHSPFWWLAWISLFFLKFIFLSFHKGVVVKNRGGERSALRDSIIVFLYRKFFNATQKKLSLSLSLFLLRAAHTAVKNESERTHAELNRTVTTECSRAPVV